MSWYPVETRKRREIQGATLLWHSIKKYLGTYDQTNRLVPRKIEYHHKFKRASDPEEPYHPYWGEHLSYIPALKLLKAREAPCWGQVVPTKPKQTGSSHPSLEHSWYTTEKSTPLQPNEVEPELNCLNSPPQVHFKYKTLIQWPTCSIAERMKMGVWQYQPVEGQQLFMTVSKCTARLFREKTTNWEIRIVPIKLRDISHGELETKFPIP